MKQVSDMSKKPCVCGGHNATNVKKNKHHHGTKVKLEVKAARKLKALAEAQVSPDPEIQEAINKNFADLFDE